ncbi:hypothetical protein [Cytobacillus oceanisediminis]|uniref:hypothetical protein n=1 Tax=Cytobacillus oceanisediminis TaxID=665099 RepID=UPI00373570EF
MEWINDSRACLDIAELMITEIDEMMKETIKHDDIIPYLKVKIKNCLENCRSPLDYAANYVFDSYCRMEYTPKELKKFNVYFPIAHKEVFFNSYIKDKYRTLSEKRPDIVSVFKNSQSFNEDKWLKHLPKLTNENKHRNLTRQTKEKTTHIAKGQIGGITIENVTMIGDGIPIQYGDTAIDFVNPSPYDHLFDASVDIEYFFEELGLSVLPTLSSIHKGSSKVINELETVV